MGSFPAASYKYLCAARAPRPPLYKYLYEVGANSPSRRPPPHVPLRAPTPQSLRRSAARPYARPLRALRPPLAHRPRRQARSVGVRSHVQHLAAARQRRRAPPHREVQQRDPNRHARPPRRPHRASRRSALALQAVEFPALSRIFSTSDEEESVRLLANPGTLLLTALGVACA